MTTVRALCLNCDRTSLLLPDQIRLTSMSGRVTYHFRCRLCGSHVSRDATPTTVALLGKAGITARTILPAPRPEIAGQPPSGPPLDEDDLLAFLRELYATA